MSLKDEVLTELSNNEYISGKEIAKRHFVSRNGVWKAIKSLREEGYDIEAVTNKGYCLKKMTEKINAAAVKSDCKDRWNVIVMEETDSTNNRAKEMAANGVNEKSVVISDSQTGGRGRIGRPFFSPKNRGLYMSILVRPKLSVDYAPLITSYTATAVSKAIEKLTGKECTQIKWVNDIYINNKKICGILTEAGFDFEGGMLDYAVIGIGINVLGEEFPADIENIATSIEKETGVKLSRNALAAEILNNVYNIENDIHDKSFLEYYRKKSNVLGKSITVYYGNESYDARAVEIDDNAALVVETENGRKTLNSGEVSIKL